MRPSLIMGLIAVVVALCVAGGAAWHMALWRSGWFRGPPALAQGIPAFAGAQSGPWSRRLAQRFPIGSSETTLIDTLRKQGFTVDLAARRAAFGWAVYPCVYTLTVVWQGDDLKRVRFIQGGLLDACTDPKYLLPERGGRGPRPLEPPPSASPSAPPDPRLVPKGQSA